jgi:RING finger protein 113A
MASTEEHINVRFFKKKGKSRPTTTRKRSISPTASSSTGHPPSSKSEVVLPTKRETSNLLTAGTKRTSSLRDALDDSGASQKVGPDVKWTAAGSHSNTAMEIIAGDEVAELLAKRRRKEREEAGLDDQDVPDDGQYRGLAAYKHHVKKDAEVSKAKRVGPQRSTNTIRTVTIIDYQPDVCKDYKGRLFQFYYIVLYTD